MFNQTIQNLTRNNSYTEIGSFQWAQLGYGSDVSNRIALQSGNLLDVDDIEEELDPSCDRPIDQDEISSVNGFVEIIISRFIHVFTDFQYSEFTSSRLENFRIRETRKINSKKIYYLDHPRFGIVFQVISKKLAKQ